MSFIDLIAIFLIICLCYIGYAKGVKGKTFFLSSFAFSCFLMYFIFESLFKKVTSIVPNLLLAGVISIGFVLIPIFVLIEFIFRKTLTDRETRSFSEAKNKIKIESRLLGAVIGFIGGYAFVLTAISLTLKHSKEENPLLNPPSFVSNSFFYRIASIGSPEDNIKKDNITTLSFLYNPSIIQKFNISAEELVIILKMIKGISNSAALEVLSLENESSEYPLLKLRELYEKESSQVLIKYKIPSSEIESLFRKITLEKVETKGNLLVKDKVKHKRN